MSLSCFLPKLCVAKKMRRPAGGDRPFPEQDYLVFPLENMYDRIVMPDRGVARAKSEKVANNNGQASWNTNYENYSTCEFEGKSVTMFKTIICDKAPKTEW